jgi:S1-C subfamily serine protease
VVGSDPDTDVAVVKIDGDGPFPSAVLGTSTDLQVGQEAVVVGWPADLVAEGPSVTVGVISGLHRTVPRADGRMLFDMVQTDARVPAGWPGGALLDSSGSVIGITTALGTANAGSGTGGFAFAIPVEVARSVADQLIASGRVTRVWLGVHGDDLDWVAAAGLEVPGGALVDNVREGSPAGRAGVAPGDVIVAVDGAPVTSMGQLVVALRQHTPGQTVRLEVLRDRQRMSMAVALVERPAQA